MVAANVPLCDRAAPSFDRVETEIIAEDLLLLRLGVMLQLTGPKQAFLNSTMSCAKQGG